MKDPVTKRISSVISGYTSTLDRIPEEDVNKKTQELLEGCKKSLSQVKTISELYDVVKKIVALPQTDSVYEMSMQLYKFANDIKHLHSDKKFQSNLTLKLWNFIEKDLDPKLSMVNESTGEIKNQVNHFVKVLK